jgi:CheY-like chemotaxis protein
MTASTLSPPHLLVVEDDPDLQRVLQNALEAMGYPTTGASSLDQALRLIQQQPVELIVTDTFSRTPQDALASLRPLRQLSHPIPIVVCTGWPVSDSVVKERGFAALVHKPSTLDHLVVTVAECLNQPFSGAQERQVVVIRRYVAAVRRWDLDALMALVTDEIIIYPWVGPLSPDVYPATGRDAARAYLQELARYFGPLQVVQQHVSVCPQGLAARCLLHWHTPEGALRERMMRLCFQFTDDGTIRQIGMPLRNGYLQVHSSPHAGDTHAAE